MKPVSLKNFLLLITGLLLHQPFIYAQESHSFRWYDSTTYAAWVAGDWASVRLFGNEAIQKGIDYNYLRMRLGAASFAAEDYKSALKHYDHALKFNNGDPDALEMKYYSRLNLGDADQAYRLAVSKGSPLKYKPGITRVHLFDFLYFESGFSPAPRYNFPQKQKTNDTIVYSGKDIAKEIWYYQAGIRLRLSPGISIFTGYNWLSQEREIQAGYLLNSIHRDSVVEEPFGKSYYYSFPLKEYDTAISYRIDQDDFYLNATFLPAEGWKVIPAMHYFRIHTVNMATQFQTVIKSDTAWYLASEDAWNLFEYPFSSYSFNRKDTSFTNMVLALSIQREIGKFTLETFGSWSDFNSISQYQAGATIKWFPYGNSNFTVSASATSIFRNRKGRLVVEPAVSYRVNERVWLNGSLTMGDLEYYNDRNGYVVYNQADPIKFRGGIDVVIFASNKLELYLVFRHYKKELKYTDYALRTGSETGSEMLNLTQSYHNQSFTGGIKWKL